jgi:hypothetical protein
LENHKYVVERKAWSSDRSRSPDGARVGGLAVPRIERMGGVLVVGGVRRLADTEVLPGGAQVNSTYDALGRLAL